MQLKMQGGKRFMILFIDNYDSFTYNLVQFCGSVNPDIKVVRNDEITVDEIKKLAPSTSSFRPAPAIRKMPEYVRRL